MLDFHLGAGGRGGVGLCGTVLDNYFVSVTVELVSFVCTWEFTAEPLKRTTSFFTSFLFSLVSLQAFAAICSNY
jgi:hypothetical protein